MKTELELELVKKYPKILRFYRGDAMSTCMAWGMECGDGWYDLLSRCMEKLQYFCDVCSKDGNELQVVADQIKEKYGTLRFYYHILATNDVQSDIISDIVAEAERKSSYTCEETGSNGNVCTKGGWLKTLSYEQARKYGYTAYDEDLEKYWKELDAKKQPKETSS